MLSNVLKMTSLTKLNSPFGSKRMRLFIDKSFSFQRTHFIFSSHKEAEKGSKLAKLQDKRNAILLVLRNGSQKLDSLRSRGAPNDLQEVKEQQKIVKVKICARQSEPRIFAV